MSPRVDSELVFSYAADERRRIADVLDGLDDDQWRCPSLCSRWDIKTVAAHLVSTLNDGTASFLAQAIRRGSMHRSIDELARRRALDPIQRIVAELRQCADRRMSPPGAGPLDPLTDVLVHSGDIRIPLDLPFAPEVDRACLALDFLTGPWRFAFVGRRLLKGVSLRATDAERAWGRGREIRGPVASLMLLASGRDALVSTLQGPGVPILRDRLRAR